MLIIIKSLHVIFLTLLDFANDCANWNSKWIVEKGILFIGRLQRLRWLHQQKWVPFQALESQFKWDKVMKYRVFIKYCVFFQESLQPLPRQHSAAIGCTKNYQPIGVTVHLHCVESFEGLLQWCRRGRGCSELWKNTIFP